MVSDVAEPQQDAVADLAVMELKHQHPVSEQPFVLRAAVVAPQAEELLIPVAGCFDIADREHGL